jgi:hypothetical protein
MFNLSADDRLSAWSQLRQSLETSETPFEDVAKFWSSAPFIPYNRSVDPFNRHAWPTPWDIVVENRYDDFTKALMMAETCKLSTRFKNSSIVIQTMVDSSQNKSYNIVIVNEEKVLNYIDNEVVNAENLPTSFLLENLIELSNPK